MDNYSIVRKKLVGLQYPVTDIETGEVISSKTIIRVLGLASSIAFVVFLNESDDDGIVVPYHKAIKIIEEGSKNGK